MAKKDDGMSEYTSAANHFFNNEVQNPNVYNKHNTFAMTIQSKLAQVDQDFIQEVITNNVEKLHWNASEIARQLKVDF